MTFRLPRLVSAVLGACLIAGAAQAAEPSKAAREAYNAGDMVRAASLAETTGDRWTGGLAAFRTKRYDDALTIFSTMAKDPAQAARRGAAAFWAARSATALGQDDQAEGLLKTAAKSSDPLYALLAKSRLGLESAAAAARALPMPSLSPTGGFTQDKALIYALVKTESRFNAAARSGSNYGLMQLSPSTAAKLGGRGGAAGLMNAETNLKLGQAYVGKLLGSVKGDLVRALAGYNMGPDAVKRATAALGAKADALLVMESLPGEGVRAYVRHVLTDYWGYRTAMKQDTGALEIASLAGG